MTPIRDGNPMKDGTLFANGFLATASDALRDVMADLAFERDLAMDEILFEQGDEGDTLYAILEGALEFSVISADGRKLSLDVMQPGAIFGEIALFDPGPRTATVTALKASRLLGVRNAEMMAALRQ